MGDTNGMERQIRSGDGLNTFLSDMAKCIASVGRPRWVGLGQTQRLIFKRHLCSRLWTFANHIFFHPAKLCSDSQKCPYFQSGFNTKSDSTIMSCKYECHTGYQFMFGYFSFLLNSQMMPLMYTSLSLFFINFFLRRSYFYQKFEIAPQQFLIIYW